MSQAIIAALRQKYKSPHQVMRALGLDSRLLYAHDEEPEPEYGS